MTIIKQCTACKKEKPENAFDSFHGKVNRQCRGCRSRHNRYYADDKNNVRTKYKEYYRANKSKFKRESFRNNLRRKYGLTIDSYQALLKGQNNKCLICDSDFQGNNRPCVDHCHRTGKVRGILCRRCNLSISYLEDKTFVQKAIDYIDKLVK